MSLPTQLVEQRPDVRAAQAQLHQASAQVGVAIANRLPQFNLTASYGSAGLLTRGDVVRSRHRDTGILRSGRRTQPIFHGVYVDASGTRGPVAAYEVADAQYRNTVLHGV